MVCDEWINEYADHDLSYWGTQLCWAGLHRGWGICETQYGVLRPRPGFVEHNRTALQMFINIIYYMFYIVGISLEW